MRNAIEMISTFQWTFRERAEAEEQFEQELTFLASEFPNNKFTTAHTLMVNDETAHSAVQRFVNRETNSEAAAVSIEGSANKYWKVKVKRYIK